MSLFTKLGNEIASPVDAAGNPRAVENVDMQRWMTEVERATLAFQAGGGIIFPDLATANASLAYNANQMAWVMGDPTPANNGVYRKIGASGSGSWARLGDLPISMIRLDNAGAGTADAIIAEPMLPLPTTPGAALLTVNILAANTGNVTLNGKPLRTNSGNEIAPGGLTAGSIHAFLDLGDHFRLLSDQASAAIVAAAEAARDAAMSAVPNAFPVDRAAMKALDTNSITAAYLKEQGREGQFVWRTGDYSSQVAADTAEGIYIKADDVAATDGAWVRAYSEQVLPEWFGAVGDGETDDAAAIEAALATGKRVHGGAKTYYSSRKIETLNIPIHLVGSGPGNTIFLFGGTGVDQGFEFVVDAFDTVTLSGFSVVTETAHEAGKVGISINGASQVSGGTTGERSRGRASVQNVHIRGEDANGWDRHLEFVSIGWWSVNKLWMRGAGVTAGTAYKGSGIVLRGAGTPVETYISDVSGYNLDKSVWCPDYCEGFFIDNFNFVNVTEGIVLGVYDAALSTLAEANCGCLAPVIGQGHINAASRGLRIVNVNQAEIGDGLLIYLDDRGFATTMRAIDLQSGAWNRIDGVTMTFSETGTPSEITGIRFGGQEGVSRSQILNVSMGNIASSSPLDTGIVFVSASTDNRIDGLSIKDADTGIDIGVDATGTVLGGNIQMSNVTTELSDASTSAIYSRSQISGTAAAPSYAFAIDPDTGMYRSAANTLAWATAGVSRMTLSTGQLSLAVSLNTTALAIGGLTRIVADGGYRYPAYTAENIASAAHAINTTDKLVGKCVFDSTNNRLMVSTGAAATSPWYVVDGSASVTPA